jgi:mono/diheme cytochrome c family protein
MVGKCCTILLATAGVAIGLCAVALAVIDITNDAEPSRTEAWVASTVLQMRVRTQKPRQPDHFATTEDDLDRASTMYQQMCAFCHGAARGRMAPFAKALSPRPRQFVIQPSERPTWMDAYAIQHGIRWTGMPSFQSLPESDIWHLALYVEGRNQARE